MPGFGGFFSMTERSTRAAAALLVDPMHDRLAMTAVTRPWRRHESHVSPDCCQETRDSMPRDAGCVGKAAVAQGRPTKLV